MTNRKSPIDVDAAWRRFERSVQGTQPAAAWQEPAAGSADVEHDAGQIHMPVHQDKVRKEPRSHSAGERKTNKNRYRPWLAAAVVAGLTIGLFTTSWGDKALAAMLQTFRVRHLTGVAIGQDDWDKVRQALQQSGLSEKELNLDKFGTVSTASGGRPQQMPLTEASKAIGAPVKLLPGQTAEQTDGAFVMPQTQFTLRLHVDEVNRVLKRLGAASLFPAGVDNQPIVGTLPVSVRISDRNGSANDRGTRSLIQMKQPQLDVPPGVDVEQVRKAVLDLPFLPEDARRKLEGAADWRQTLFVPVDGKSSTTLIDGREVIYTGQDRRRTAIWLDGEWLYYLDGSYDSSDALLRDVKEIIGS